MKKIILIVLALALVVIGVMSCNSAKEESLVGEYGAEIDNGKAIEEDGANVANVDDDGDSTSALNTALASESAPTAKEPTVKVTFVFDKDIVIDGTTYQANKENLFQIALGEDETLSDLFGWENLKYVTKIEFMPAFSNTKLCKNQFRYCTKVESISLPNSIEEIGELAFGDCYSLKTIHFPTSLKTIETEAFYKCKSLESVDLSETFVTLIGANAFRYCESLKTVVFGKDVNDWTRIDEIRTLISSEDWEDLTNEEKLDINKEYSNLMKAVKYLVIKGAAFQDCYSLETVSNLQRNLKSIGPSCFQNDKNLKTINYNWYYDYPNESFSRVERYYAWNYRTGDFEVVCLEQN